MPRVDFYILAVPGNRERFTCDIAAKIHQQELQLYIHTGSREEAVMLDNLMWTFKDISFLPHCLIDADDSDSSTITIGWQGTTAKSNEVLINLSTTVPEFVDSFERIVEIVAPDNPNKQQARARYLHYREAGCELHNHNLGAAHAPA